MLKILDGSAGFGKPLTEQEIKEFLSTKILNLYLGTIGTITILPRRRSMSRQENILRKWKMFPGTIRSTFA
jgi:hypothetical protein